MVRALAHPASGVFVKRVLDRREVVLLAHRGRGIDHPSAAVNIAALVRTVAAKPGRRILNSADPDAPSGVEIASAVALYLAHEWDEVPLDEDADPALGWHPWDRRFPVVLDTNAAVELGYIPVGDYATTVRDEIDWLVSTARYADGAQLPPDFDGRYFAAAFDYVREDRFLGNQ